MPAHFPFSFPLLDLNVEDEQNKTKFSLVDA